MDKEKKIILIGIASTLLVVLIAFLIIYLIYQNKDNNSNVSNTDTNVNSNVEENNSNTENNIDTENNTDDEQNHESELETNEKTDVDSTIEEDTKTVTLYLFRGRGCHFCENAIEFLESIADDYNYLDIKTYEIWYNDENNKLMEEVSNELGIEVSDSVPFIVIGTEFARRGFSENMEDSIRRAIESAHESENYEDVINNVLEANNLNVEEETIN